MAAILAFAQRPIPRPLLIIGVPLAGILLTGLFIFLGFPYDRLAQRFEIQLEQLVGMPVRIGAVSPHLGFAGPGFEFERAIVEVDRRAIEFDRVVVRPAWSLSWLQGAPAIHLDLTGEPGDAAGTLTLGSAPGWNGELENVQLALVPQHLLLPGLDLSGRLDADVDLRSSETGIEGDLELTARDGSLTVPGLPMALPFTGLEGQLVFGGEHYADIIALQLEGPMVSGDATGQIGRARVAGHEPLNIQLGLKVHGPELTTMVRSMGVPLEADGSAQLQLAGTLRNPAVR